MARASNDWKTSEGALLTYCYNLDCLSPFHLVPRNEDEEKFFSELMVGPSLRGPSKLMLICPRCGAFVEVLTSTLEACTCGQEPHSPLHKA